MRHDRRRFLLLTLTGAVGTTLAACGTSASPTDGASTAQTRTVATINGDVAVPTNPQRIVALNFPEATTLIDLGLKPVGLPDYLPNFPAYQEAAKSTPAITTSPSVDLEKVASLTPDLIIAGDWLDESKRTSDYAKLSVIAPTAIFEWQMAAGNWRTEAQNTADAVGLSDKFAELKKSYEDRAAAIKSTYATTLGETTWDFISGGTTDAWYLYSPSSSHGSVLGDAGVQFGASKGQQDNFLELSPEKLDLLAKTDVLMTDPTSFAELSKLQLFKSLPAAKAGHVFVTDFSFPSSYQVASSLLADVEKSLKAIG